MADKWEERATIIEPDDKWEKQSTIIDESVKKKVSSDVSTTPVSQDSKPSTQSFDFGELAPVEGKVKTTKPEFTAPTAQQDILKEKPAPVEFESDVEKFKKLRNKQVESKLAYQQAIKSGDNEAALKATIDADNYKKQADEISQNLAKERGYSGTKLGLFDTFINSAHNAIDEMEFGNAFMGATPEKRLEMLKERKDRREATNLQPQEGSPLYNLAQGASSTAGTIAPFMGLGLATGGEGLLPLVASSGGFGLLGIGSKADEAFSKAKEEGKSDEEALQIATNQATLGAVTETLMGGVFHGVGSKEIPKSFTDWLVNTGKKNATIGAVASAFKALSNYAEGKQGLSTKVSDEVLQTGVTYGGLGILMDGLHKLGSEISNVDKSKIQNVIAYTNPDAAIIGVNKAVDAGKMTRAEANELIPPIAEKARVFNAMPEDMSFEKKQELSPIVEEIKKLEAKVKDADVLDADRANYERQIVELNRKYAEENGHPLTDEEKVAHFELGEKQRNEGKLNPIEKRDLEHYQTRIDKIKEEKKAEKDLVAEGKLKEAEAKLEANKKFSELMPQVSGEKEVESEIKSKENDTENKTGLPSEVGIGQESIETKPIEGGSDQEIDASGDVQTHEEEVKFSSENKPSKEKPYVSKNGKFHVFVDESGNMVAEAIDGREVSDKTKRAYVNEAKENFSYDTGKDFEGQAESLEHLIDQSTNPAEIAEIVKSEPKHIPEDSLDYVQRAIAHNIGRVKTNDYFRITGNKGKDVSEQVRRAYLSEKGNSLDQIAMQAEIDAFGDYDAENPRITEQDVVDFMEQYDSPEAFWKQKNPIFEKAANRFKELTGIKLDDKTIKLATDEKSQRETRKRLSENQRTENQGATGSASESPKKTSEPLPESIFAKIDEAKRSKKSVKEKQKVAREAVKDMGEVGEKAIFVDENFTEIKQKLNDLIKQGKITNLKIEC